MRPLLIIGVLIALVFITCDAKKLEDMLLGGKRQNNVQQNQAKSGGGFAADGHPHERRTLEEILNEIRSEGDPAASNGGVPGAERPHNNQISGVRRRELAARLQNHLQQLKEKHHKKDPSKR